MRGLDPREAPAPRPVRRPPTPPLEAGAGQPFVSESSLARHPALRSEVDLLEREVGPAFRRLDEGSLRTQNGFRLGQLSLIVGGAVASALGAVQTGFGGGVVTLAITEAVVAGVLAGATVYIRGRNAQREDFTSRLKAERLRAEYFLALAHCGDYAVSDDAERLVRLRAGIGQSSRGREQA